MAKRFWVGLVLLAFIGASFTAATISVSPAYAAACFSSFTNKTTAMGCCGVFGQWYRLIFYAARTCCW